MEVLEDVDCEQIVISATLGSAGSDARWLSAVNAEVFGPRTLHRTIWVGLVEFSKRRDTAKTVQFHLETAANLVGASEHELPTYLERLRILSEAARPFADSALIRLIDLFLRRTSRVPEAGKAVKPEDAIPALDELERRLLAYAGRKELSVSGGDSKN